MKTIKELKKETIWEKGKVTTIGSQDIEEKTFLALNEGLKAAKSGKNVLYLSLPYNKIEIETRLIYILFDEGINFKEATSLAKKLPIEINDKFFLTTLDIVELLKKRENIDLLIIDPLDMMNLLMIDPLDMMGLTFLNGDTREERFIDIVKKLKKLANDLGVGIILTSHIKRGDVEDDDLKEGKEIAALSDKYFAIKGVN